MNQLTCPITTCRAKNDIGAEVCIQCSTPLSTYRRLSLYPAQLFNKGLEAARQGQAKRARDLFAAVVYWCPNDKEARNALAMTCYELKDFMEARLHWQVVLAQTSHDALALQGMKALEIAIKNQGSQASIAIKRRAVKKLLRTHKSSK